MEKFWVMEKNLLTFGHGYTAKEFTKQLLPKGWKITGTTRDHNKINPLCETGISALLWDDQKLEKVIFNSSRN